LVLPSTSFFSKIARSSTHYRLTSNKSTKKTLPSSSNPTASKKLSASFRKKQNPIMPSSIPSSTSLTKTHQSSPKFDHPMKHKLPVLIVCLLIPCTLFSQPTSPLPTLSNPSASVDSIPPVPTYQITPAQLRAACLIFSDHDRLKSENNLLTVQISLLNRSASAKDYIINSQSDQIAALNAIIANNNAVIANNETAIISLKSTHSKIKNQKSKMTAAAIGASAAAILIAILK